jgi:hypothetical protein
LSPILHLTSADSFNALPDSAPCVPEAFEADGFIHCTGDAETLLNVANRFYKNAPGEMLVLVIDPAKVAAAELKWELPSHTDGTPAVPGEPLFPHLYGPLNREAIIQIRSATRAPDGTFLAV